MKVKQSYVCAALFACMLIVFTACGDSNVLIGEWEPQPSDNPMSMQYIAGHKMGSVVFDDNKVITGNNALSVDEYDTRDEITYVMLRNGESFAVEVIDDDTIELDIGLGSVTLDRVN